MTRLRVGQLFGFGVLGLALSAWAGTASAAQWANPDLLVTPETVKANIDKPDWDMNTLVSHSRSMLFGKESVGVRLPGWLAVFIGYGFDALAAITKKRMMISSIRVKKFMGTTAFNTSVVESGFIPPFTLAEGLEKTLKHEFLEENNDETLFYTE